LVPFRLSEAQELIYDLQKRLEQLDIGLQEYKVIFFEMRYVGPFF